MTCIQPMLEVKDLKIALPVERGILHAVRGISFHINAGESVCLVGESGCGKSLTALALMGLLSRTARCSADALQFDGKDLFAMQRSTNAAFRGRDIAMIFQDPMTSLNPTLTIERQLCEGAVYRGMPREAARKRAISLLDRVGISRADARLSLYPHQFSGGQRQRVMIAMALMEQPKLLIADEPTTALDVTIQVQILNLIQELRQEMGLALLLITHDLGVVAGIADRVCVMYAGRIVEQGQASDVFSRPLHPYTRGLMGAIPIPGSTVPGSELTAIPGRVPELIGTVQGCAFAPRCSEALPACSNQTPPLRWRGAERSFECLLESGTDGGAL